MSEKGNSCGYKIQRTGDNVSELLDKIENLDLATPEIAGLLSALDKRKLDNMTIRFNTTQYWNSQIGYIPKAGEIIIYADYKTLLIDGKMVNIPAIKIGTGNAYIQDLVFIGGNGVDQDMLLAHIADAIVHVTQADRDFWNNKLNVTDYHEVVDEALIFNRN